MARILESRPKQPTRAAAAPPRRESARVPLPIWFFSTVLHPGTKHPLVHLAQAAVSAMERLFNVVREAVYAYYAIGSLILMSMLVMRGQWLLAFAVSLIGVFFSRLLLIELRSWVERRQLRMSAGDEEEMYRRPGM
jgi:hypothetical protein